MLTYKDLSVWVSGKHITDYISFIWTDRYNECGDFEMEVPYTAENERFYKVDQIVTCSFSNKKMIIETIKISISEENGKRMLLTGRSWESVLDRRVVAMTQVYDNEFFSNDKFMNAFRAIFKVTFGRDNKSQVLTKTQTDPNRKDYKEARIWNSKRSTNISVGKRNDPNGHIKNAQINIESTNKTVLELLKEHCQSKEFGFEMVDNVCYIYDGEMKNVEFSMEKGNLISVDYQASKQNYKNVAYVQGEEYTVMKGKYEINDVVIDPSQLADNQALILTPEDANEEAVYYRTEVDLTGASGLDRREIAIDSSKALGENSNYKYIARLQSDGRLALLKDHRWEIQASCEVMHDPNLEYRKDYYLGDIVNVSLDTIYNVMDASGNKYSIKNIKMRVNEYTISHSDAGLDLYPTLVAYDADKYYESNNSDAGIDPSEDLDASDEWMKDFVRVNFFFNGGHLEGETGALYTFGGKKGEYIKNANKPFWYIIPEEMNSGVIEMSAITGKFSYQQKGNFISFVDVEPKKDHYIFQGWYIGGTKLEEHVPGDDSTGYIIGKGESEIDVYAKWEIERFDITFEHGEGGIFLTGGANKDGQIIRNYPYGAYPSPPTVCAEPDYQPASPLWSPDIVAVTGEATYTAQWEQIERTESEEMDPEESDYENEDLPSEGTSSRSRDKRSTVKETPETSEEDEQYYNLVHFRSYASAYNDVFQNPHWESNKPIVDLFGDPEEQGGEFYFVRELDDGFKVIAYWFDPYHCVYTKNNKYIRGATLKNKEAAQHFSGMHDTYFGISLWKDEHPIGLWYWNTVGGLHYTPELAFTTVPEYEPYYEKKTLQWGYDNGEIQYGALHLAPVFKPFKYYRYYRDKYWKLCVPPLDWLTNWGNYYYDHMAGYDVGFCCQYYDDLANVLSPTWSRGDGQYSNKVTIDNVEYGLDTELYYNTYYTHGPSIYYTKHDGPNTIFPPNCLRNASNASSVRTVSFKESWTKMGWQYRRIPKERFEADGSQLYSGEDPRDPSKSSFANMINYSGNLLLNEQSRVGFTISWEGSTTTEGDGWVFNLGTVFGPDFYGFTKYGTYHRDYYGNSHWYYWDVKERAPGIFEGDASEDPGILGKWFAASGDEEIIHKMSGSETMASKVMEDISNVISKSKSLSYFTYQVFLPIMAKIKKRKWYVSANGNEWYLINGAEGNSLEVRTTDKTVAQQQEAGLSGADAIIGTNNSYYKSEVYYVDEQGREFMQTSGTAQLMINDTDISGSDIEMDEYMNPDGTTNGIDIETETDWSKVTDEMNLDDINFDQMTDIENLLDSGSTAKQISEATGIPESIINMIIKKLQEEE